MCGVVGCVTLERSSLADALKAMQSVQIHRGPDQQGEWLGCNIALSSSRLSIIDITDAASQPMQTADGRHFLAYNGELYNFRQLRSQLESEGQTFRTKSDTEVILQALAAHGEAILPQLDGMFAFAFLDTQRQTLLLARDRSGIKPLHYYHANGVFLFASEIKSIWAALGRSGLQPDLLALRELLTLGYSYGSTTPFLGVKTLDPGTALRFDIAHGTVDNFRYCDLLECVTAEHWELQEMRSHQEIERELATALQRSVQAHLISDVPVGVICSGGVDSSLIAALAQQFQPGIDLYHASIPGPGGELQFAQRVADHLATPLHVAEINARNFLRHWPLAIYHNDFPSYHPNDVPLYLVCQLARDRGFKVLLSGEGADELFGGYLVNLELKRRNRSRELLGHRFGKRVGDILQPASEAKISDQTSLGSFADLADITGSASLGRIRRMLTAELLVQGRGERIRRSTEIRNRLAFLPHQELTTAAYLLERLFGHLGSLLLRNDRMGMMASIETRIPYLSNELLATWIPMPLRFKIQAGDHRGLKYLLKRIAARLLPSDIVYRPKQGFPVPLKTFLKPDPQIFASGFLEEVFGLVPDVAEMVSRDVSQYYQFASMELWGRIFFRNESPEEWGNWLVNRCMPA